MMARTRTTPGMETPRSRCRVVSGVHHHDSLGLHSARLLLEKWVCFLFQTMYSLYFLLRGFELSCLT